MEDWNGDAWAPPDVRNLVIKISFIEMAVSSFRVAGESI
jgi:hypothetical protein